MTFKKYHIKKKKPVTNTGNLSAKLLEGFEYPSASAAAAATTGKSTEPRRLNNSVQPENLKALPEDSTGVRGPRFSGNGENAKHVALEVNDRALSITGFVVPLLGDEYSEENREVWTEEWNKLVIEAIVGFWKWKRFIFPSFGWVGLGGRCWFLTWFLGMEKQQDESTMKLKNVEEKGCCPQPIKERL